MLCVVQGTVSIAGYTLWAGVRRLCMVGGRYIGHKEVRHNCGKGTLGE